MYQLRSRLVVFTATLVIVGTAACSKKNAGGGTGKIEGAASSAMTVLPKDTGFMIGLSIPKLKQTKLYEQMAPKLLEKGQAKLDDIKKDCGIDVLSDLESVVVTGPDTGAVDIEKKILVLIKGKWDEDKVNKCLTTMAAKDNKKMNITKDGKITEYAAEGESDKLYAAWLDKGMILISTDISNKAYLSEVLAGKSSVNDNTAFMDLLKKSDTKATLYGAMLIPKSGEAAAAFAQMGSTPEGGYMSLNYAKDLDATVGLHYADDKSAKETADKINKEMEGAKSQPMVAEYVKGVKIEANGRDTVITVHLSETQLDALMALVQMQLGPMLQMMGGGMDMGGGMGGGDMGGGDEPPPAVPPAPPGQ